MSNEPTEDSSDQPTPSKNPTVRGNEHTEDLSILTGPSDESDFAMQLSTVMAASSSSSFNGLPEKLGRYRIDQQIGRGGFGIVLRGWDPSLQREVAIKVGRPERVKRVGAEIYLREARMQASLDHPHIASIHDCGELPDGGFYIVTKYYPGGTLEDIIKRGVKRDLTQHVSLIAKLADALENAHAAGIIHRDIKPANILLDDQGAPVLTDFGLALRDSDMTRESGIVGSPAYMSPEQARGEGHRVDCRSDIYSLGVVLYELLRGQRPFSSENRSGLFDQICFAEPAPLSEVAPNTPIEIARICHKALRKLPSERYRSAGDMASELRSWLQATRGVDASSARPNEAPRLTDTEIVPRGLRAFDRADARFFLDLLPGVKDKDGLPESILFWKQRIEPGHRFEPFRVGMLLGPSGIGKSSLVRAGLLPHLDSRVMATITNARSSRLEARILEDVQNHVAGTPSNLTDTLAAIRRGEFLPPANKLLVVIDQFEQFLHRAEDLSKSELLAALRQCDGHRVQALLLVRDDFISAANQFMELVEEPLSQEANLAFMDLFPRSHARNVLVAYGRALGTLPRDELGREQSRFVDAAIDGLLEDGKIIPVRLALLAEMLKDLAWVPGTLNRFGGMGGLAEAFLADKLAGAAAHPIAKAHPDATRRLLKLLLPDEEAPLHRRAVAKTDLIDGVADLVPPETAEKLLEALDVDLKLVTAGTAALDRTTESASLHSDTHLDSASTTHQGLADRRQLHYQLTHDYLIAPLHRWLHRSEMETWSGQARFRLRELARLYRSSPESKVVPNPLEYFWLRALTKPRDWDARQRELMSKAKRRAFLRGATLASLSVLAGTSWWYYERERSARQIINGLSTTRVVDASDSIRSAHSRIDIPERLQKAPEAVSNRLHYWLALVGKQPEALTNALEHLPTDAPKDIAEIASLIQPHREQAINQLIERIATHGNNSKHQETDHQSQVLSELALLAILHPTWEDWPMHYDQAMHSLVAAPSAQRPNWTANFQSLGAGFANATLDRIDQHASELAPAIRPAWISTAGLLCRELPDELARLCALCDGRELDAELLPLDPFMAQTLRPRAIDLFQTLDKNRTLPVQPPPGLAQAEWERLLDLVRRHNGQLNQFGCVLVEIAETDFATLNESLLAAGYRPTAIRQLRIDSNLPPRISSTWTRDQLPSQWMRLESHEDLFATVAGEQQRGWRVEDFSRWNDDPVQWSIVWVQDERIPTWDLAPLTDLYQVGNELPAANSPFFGLTLAPPAASTEFNNLSENNISSTDPSTSPTLYRFIPTAMNQQNGQVENSSGGLDSFGDRRPDLPLEEIRLRGAEHLGLDTEILLRRLFSLENPWRDPKQPQDAPVELSNDQRDNIISAASYLIRADRPATALKLLDQWQHELPVSEHDNVLGLRIRALVDTGQREAARNLVGYQQSALNTEQKEGIPPRPATDSETSGDAVEPTPSEDDSAEPTLNFVRVSWGDRIRLAHDDELDNLYDRLRTDIAADQAQTPSLATVEMGKALALLSQRWQSNAPDIAEQLVSQAVSQLARFFRSPRYQRYTFQTWFDPDYNQLRAHPEFWELLHNADAHVRYTAIWSYRQGIEDDFIPPSSPDTHARRAAQLLSTGFVPVDISSCASNQQGQIMVASVWHRPHDRLESDEHSRRRAVLAVLSAHLGDPGPLRECFTSEGALRDEAIAAAADSQLAPQQLIEWLAGSGDQRLRYSSLLTLGFLGAKRLEATERQATVTEALRARGDSLASVASAAHWCLKQLVEDARDIAPLTEAPTAANFRILDDGLFLVRLEPPRFVRIGTPFDEPGLSSSELCHWVTGLRPFEISATEITVSQFRQFWDAATWPDKITGEAFSFSQKYAPSDDCPQISVRLWEAMMYCQWRSEQEGIPEADWCYPGIFTCDKPGEYELPPDFASRRGYRLPLEEEWEYAARAGTMSARPFGETTRLIRRYAHVEDNLASFRAQPVGSYAPNAYGLFDMLGNAQEWCQDTLDVWRLPFDRYYRNGATLNDSDLTPLATEQSRSRRDVVELKDHIVRGGSFSDAVEFIRSGDRSTRGPEVKQYSLGFRIVRTAQ